MGFCNPTEKSVLKSLLTHWPLFHSFCYEMWIVHSHVYRLSGQVGYVTANVKSSTGTLVGDTMYHKSEPVEPLPGFRPAKAMVGQCQLCIWLVIGQMTLTGTCRSTDKQPSFINFARQRLSLLHSHYDGSPIWTCLLLPKEWKNFSCDIKTNNFEQSLTILTILLKIKCIKDELSKRELCLLTMQNCTFKSFSFIVCLLKGLFQNWLIFAKYSIMKVRNETFVECWF